MHQGQSICMHLRYFFGGCRQISIFGLWENGVCESDFCDWMLRDFLALRFSCKDIMNSQHCCGSTSASELSDHFGENEAELVNKTNNEQALNQIM